MKIGYHASHEQHSPSDLLALVCLAERAGFDQAMCSDHFMPFSEGQGNSGFAWSWLGAALQATGLSLGVVTSPGYRYHPAVVAQAAATLGEMYPGRFWLALGSGELLNEHVTGQPWPDKEERNARLLASVEVIRRLLAGETVTCDGPVRVDAARLYVRPASAIRMFGAAITPETADWVAGWADGLITVAAPRPNLEEVINAFRQGGGKSKPMVLQAQHSFALTDEEARAAAFEQWRIAALASDVMTELKTPADIDAATKDAQPQDVLKNVRASADPAQHLAWLREYGDLGFDAVFLHNVQRDDRTFIRRFGDEVLPTLRG